MKRFIVLVLMVMLSVAPSLAISHSRAAHAATLRLPPPISAMLQAWPPNCSTPQGQWVYGYCSTWNATFEVRCSFINPSPYEVRVLVYFYIDGQQYTQHDGIMQPYSSFYDARLADVIPDMPPQSTIVFQQWPAIWYYCYNP